MKKLFVSISSIMLLLVWIFYPVTGAVIINVENMPPVVVQTIPQAGKIDVDPGIKEIRVVFSKEMQTEQMWSVVKVSNDTCPKFSGQVHFLPDKKTFIIPVSLEPGKTYAVWLNNQNYNYFKDLGNRSAVPYLLVFETKQ